MTFRTRKFAVAASLTLAGFAAASGAVAQPVTSSPVVQPIVVAPAALPGDPAYVGAVVQPLPYNAGPPPMTGSVAGTTAADRDGDGIVDGYYTTDGFYHPYVAPTPAAAPRYVSRRGERG
jgi:hypothetical protein